MKEPWIFFRSKDNKSDLGVEYAISHPWLVADHELERLKEIMARGRPPKSNPVASQLGEALAFVSVAGTKDYKHVWLEANEACMTDGQLFAGFPIEEDLNCCPHLDQLRTALAKCGKSLAITELETGRISVKGDKLRALIPCMKAEDLPDIEPDPMQGPVDDRLKEAFKVCGVLASENATIPCEASLMLEPYICSSTNRKVAIQYNHGLNLPPAQLVLPKIFTQAVAKCPHKIVGMGWSPDHSITIHFENKAWLKTLLYADPYPNVNSLFNAENLGPEDIPADFMDGVDAIKDFNDNTIYLRDGQIQSHPSDEAGAQYEIKNLAAMEGALDAELLKLWVPLAKQWDYSAYDRIFFFGENMRGVTTVIVG